MEAFQKSLASQPYLGGSASSDAETVLKSNSSRSENECRWGLLPPPPGRASAGKTDKKSVNVPATMSIPSRSGSEGEVKYQVRQQTKG